MKCIYMPFKAFKEYLSFDHGQHVCYLHVIVFIDCIKVPALFIVS